MLDNLVRVQNHFASLKAANCSPTLELDNAMNLAILKVVALAENARKPGLNLQTFDSFSAFAQVLKSGVQAPFRGLIPMPNDSQHRLAVDVTFQDGKASIIAVESMNIEGLPEHFDLHQLGMLAELPESARMTVIASNAQMSQADCAIFAASSALKMHENAELFATMHRQQFAGEPLGETALKEDQDASEGRIGLVDGTSLLPAGFVKHANSKTQLNAWLSVNGGAANVPASSKRPDGPTLLSRHENLRVTRTGENGPKPMGISIEDKRMTLLSRCIRYLSQAPDNEVSMALQSFERYTPDLDEKLHKAAPLVTGQIYRKP
ncbi:YopJ family acetyltransferase [Acidovorax sp. SUPP3334]|uniref:YopJ family acetyltransferase n=1 Tax=Acidovorax sp. SUPP3334 TaxID=2920881 RepID=UPI0023DE695C|nr:YopJ family acetyltransferase [Acidovorax sp. SUPP3334]GKT24476.1 hypothetical protein AVHM3334_14895 [Acidovorax sp. SUPP3334]